MKNVYYIISRLEKARIYFDLSRTRDSVISIVAAIPGERWEIDVHEDGRIDFEVFSSSGDIYGEEELITRIDSLKSP